MEQSSTNQNKAKVPFKMYAISMVLLLGVCLSRIYLGVHSINQVVTGVLLSWAVFEAFDLFRKIIVARFKK